LSKDKKIVAGVGRQIRNA